MNIREKIKTSWPAVLAPIAFLIVSLPAQAVTPFEQDVGTGIDRGIEWLANSGAYNNPSSAGEAAGLSLLALLEKRASGDINDPIQGYNGANATDQGRMRNAAAYILDQVNETTFYAYRDGAWVEDHLWPETELPLIVNDSVDAWNELEEKRVSAQNQLATQSGGQAKPEKPKRMARSPSPPAPTTPAMAV